MFHSSAKALVTAASMPPKARIKGDCCMKDFVEQQITTAVRGILTGRVNEILGDTEFSIPSIEFGEYCGDTAVSPVIFLTACECSEKERILRLDAYFMTIVFTLPETPECELNCYAYSAAVCKAMNENPTLRGLADRAVVSGKKYVKPKKPNCGEGWGVVITVRITVSNE
jgi:hypothetical protein